MKRVAVLRGGPSLEHDVSMRSGASVLEALKQHPYHCQDIVITKRGEWLENGFIKNPEKILDAVDVVFLALHGQYGEDGQVQKILQRKQIPFTGSRSLPSAIAFNKQLTKKTLVGYGVKTPRYRTFYRSELENLSENTAQIMLDIGPELLIKPVTGGSSLGIVATNDETSLKNALFKLLSDHEQLLIEEFVRGREATVGVISNFRNQDIYALPVVEIVPPEGKSVFTYDDKYSGQTREICPANFTYHEKSRLTEIATLVHKILGCEHYTRSDFIVRNGEVYFLELNTLPGLTPESLFPKAAAAVGLNFPELIKHLVETAAV
ncbi:D-alanine--D-alanine ligase [Candidatus Kaiserbacteria bacterium]|nr:D-alanine--D-alanine ligase [Candidatus Kaiserbacteria bacterium]